MFEVSIAVPDEYNILNISEINQYSIPVLTSSVLWEAVARLLS